MKLIANWTIRRDGERLAPGTAFESNDAGLVACGAARLADADDGAVVDGSPPTDGDSAAPADRAAVSARPCTTC